MRETVDVLSAVDLRLLPAPLPSDATWLNEYAGFVARAYERAFRVGDALELQALMRELTRRLRVDGVPPERTIAAMKSLLPVVPRRDAWPRAIEPRRVRDDAVRWCIDEYYAPDRHVALRVMR
jgi:hypothetical protein